MNKEQKEKRDLIIGSILIIISIPFIIITHYIDISLVIIILLVPSLGITLILMRKDNQSDYLPIKGDNKHE